LQNQVKEWLSSANGTVGSLKIEPNDGIAIKITFLKKNKLFNPELNLKHSYYEEI
jgi:hypothetical protein